MDQRIFDQLDRLQRGARETLPRRVPQNYNNSEYNRYVEDEHARHNDSAWYDGEEQYADENVDPRGYRGLLPHQEQEVWQSQGPFDRPGVLGAPEELQPRRPLAAQAQRQAPARTFDLSQSAFDGQPGGSSSSAFDQPQLSSPSFSASQRRPARVEPSDYRCTAHTRDDVLAGEVNNSYRLRGDGGIASSTYDGPNPAFASTAEPAQHSARPQPAPRRSAGDPPIVQGIRLVPIRDLPDRFRSVFPFPLLNAVQSKCFPVIYSTDDNFVLSSPTGSGKTVILELAICRIINGLANGTYKIIYQAPTKSLCAERQRDWQAKFGPFDLQVAELTGDTDNAQLRNVQHASIIITTPEKWDSMTRKWKDHAKLMQMVKLFLIDEVHILKESRGATLEAIVSRMKSIGSNIRFVALSATVPNAQDIATWLGKNPTMPNVPAPLERFGEEFRPVRLAKHVCGYNATSNDFAFEKLLNGRLPEVIAKWSQRKPIMVFCFTRNACVETAKLLANWWANKAPGERYWEAPSKRLVMDNKDLRETASSGVAFHHAGLSIQDRNTIEKGYLDGHINVICCTSTLAVGVNLPCHMVIIKNTVTYQNNACKEYSDLDVMQMLGRAGRPQFDNSAVAIIMTRLHRVEYYEKMVTGQDKLESCLHLNLIDHLNAEIGLGTITNASSAKKWLSGTFLYVRLKENPKHYRLDGDTLVRNLDERLEVICNNALQRLEKHDLVKSTPKLHCTEFGDAMARYYLQFDTMKILLTLPSRAKTSEVLSAMAQAAEFKELRFRGGEKTTYKALNKNGSIKFPIPVNLDAAAHKVSLVVQSVLGSVEFPTEDYKQKLDYATAKAVIFQSIHRIARCIIDCQLFLKDSVTARNALALARSLSAQVWDDSPLCMKQLDGLGIVKVRKLAAVGIKTIDDIENAEPHRLEQILSHNPPYGTKLHDLARAFPKLRLSLKLVGEPIIKRNEHIAVRVRAEIGLVNEKTPDMFKMRPIYVCLIAETSDGHLMHFARISAKKLNNGQDVLFGATLTNANQAIRVYVMCDALAGTMRHASVKPEIPAAAFPPPKTAAEVNDQRALVSHAPNTAKRRIEAAASRENIEEDVDEFGDATIDDLDLVLAGSGGFANIEDFEHATDHVPKGKGKAKSHRSVVSAAGTEEWQPRQLDNGKWACNHMCKDKTACKHMCCREGLDKQPKPPKPKDKATQAESVADPKQLKMKLPVKKEPSLPNPAPSTKFKSNGPMKKKLIEGKEINSVNCLRETIESQTPPVPLLSSTAQGAALNKPMARPSQSKLSFSQAARKAEQEAESSYYGEVDDLLSPEKLIHHTFAKQPNASDRTTSPFHDGEDEMLDLDSADFRNDGTSNETAFPTIYDREGPEFQELSYEIMDAADTDPMTALEDDTAQHPASVRIPFSEDTSDFFAIDLDLRSDRKRTLHEEGTETSAKRFKPLGGVSTSRMQRNSTANDGSALTSSEADAINTPIPDPSAQVPEAKVSGPDSLGKWFEEQFGTDDFNYVGRREEV